MIVSGKKYKNLLEKYGIVLDRLTDKIHERDRLAAENAELKARYLHVAELNHNQVSMVRADCAHLAAANVALDSLRDLFGPDKIISNSTCMKAVDILYPSIRDIADRHGFAPMPAELGQQNVNDHTTTAALAKENDNGN